MGKSLEEIGNRFLHDVKVVSRPSQTFDESKVLNFLYSLPWKQLEE